MIITNPINDMNIKYRVKLQWENLDVSNNRQHFLACEPAASAVYGHALCLVRT